MTSVPDRTEAAEYYFRYIDLVPEGDICSLLEAQGRETADMLLGIGGAQSLHRYAPGKWTIRGVLGHIIDAERLFVFRAMWFARGFDAPLPSFDQDTAASAAGADDRPWPGLVEEFSALRASSAIFFRSLPSEAWTRRGIASDCPFTVRALAYVTFGHVAHHVKVLGERYLTLAPP
jgi:hypothetical protein